MNNETKRPVFTQRTEVVDDASWVMGFLDIIDPALDNIKKFLKWGSDSDFRSRDALINNSETNFSASEGSSVRSAMDEGNGEGKASDFDLDGFIKDKLSLDASNLDAQMEKFEPRKMKSYQRILQTEVKTATTSQSP